MTSDYDYKVKQHFDRVAQVYKDAPTSTMADFFIRETETTFIRDVIFEYTNKQEASHMECGGYAFGPGANGRFLILDVGCGNGFTLNRMSEEFARFEFAGVEFNAALREIARDRFRGHEIDISEGDVRVSESLPRTKCDILISQRVIINLLDPVDQRTALNNLVEIVNSGGLLIFIEAFKSGLDNLNDARSEFGLHPLPPAHHNLYLDDTFFDHPLLVPFDNSRADFLSTHYFVSRVLHETFRIARGQEFVRNTNFVSFFSHALPGSIGKYSPIKLLAFTKASDPH